MSHFFDDAPGTVSAPTREDRADYDALAELFMSDEPAPTLRLSDSRSVTEEQTDTPETTEPVAQTPRAAHTVEALVLGHLPILAGAWAAQHARCLAEESDHAVALARYAADTATIQLIAPRDELTEADSLEDAVTAAATRNPDWSIRVEAPSELDLAAASSITRITLLSGADEAAIVAAYRTLKGICEIIPDDDSRTIAVRIMGANDKDAEEAAQKIQRVTNAFLSREITFLPPSQKINAGSGVTLFRGPDENGYESLLASIASQPSDIETPERKAIPETATTAQPLSLAERAGFTPVTITCPAAPNVHLATDDAGTLHLLCESENAVEDLLVAESWATANAPMIRAAAGLAEDAEIIPRVLTSTPAQSRRLLDSRYRVDLLHEVRVGDQTTWCRVPLNSDN